MKKFVIIITSIITCLLIFSGCGNSPQISDDYDSLSSQEEYCLKLAKEAKSYEEVLSILQENDSAKFQVALAKLENNIVQEAMLGYDKLNSEALIIICETPHMRNINYYKTRDLFVDAIVSANLTSEQEVRIVKTNKYPMQLGVLSRDSLNGDALIYILEYNNNNIFAPLNIDYVENKDLIFQQVLKTSLTLEQKEKLRKLNVSIVNDALVKREIKSNEN